MKNNAMKKYFYISLTVLGTAALGGLVLMLLFYTDDLTHAVKRLLAIPQPFIYGAVIAYILTPVCRLLENILTRLEHRLFKKKHPKFLRACSVGLSFAFGLLLIFLFFVAVIPQLVTSISAIISLIPEVMTDFQIWLETLENGEWSHELVVALEEAITTLSKWLEDFLSTDLLPQMQALISNVTSSVFSLIDVLKNFGIGCIVAFYLLSGRERFCAQAKLLLYSIFNQTWADRILAEVHYADRMFSGFLSGQLLDSAIIGLICFCFTSLTKTPYALLISVIVGVTNMIPFFGPYLGAIPSAIFILMVSPSQCLLFLLFILILQQIDGNVISPHILGEKLGISGIWVLFAILFFGSLWGLLGMLIGVPVFAILYDLIRKSIRLGLRRQKQEAMLEDYRRNFPED